MARRSASPCHHNLHQNRDSTGANTRMKTKSEVLLVDDNPADIELTSDILARCSATHEISTVSDGKQAIEFLRRQGKYSGASTPDLVITDLNMPHKDGRALLNEVKTDPALRRTPVIVFSSSEASVDIKGSLELGANSYVTKPGNLHDFVSTVTSIGEYWLQCAILPSREKS
jgi:chemotaxis family two-component system response regulator Rcp1